MNQNEIVLDYMKTHGSITPLEAMQMGIMRLASRISDLRKMGYAIIRTMESHVNAKGVKKTYARYSLA